LEAAPVSKTVVNYLVKTNEDWTDGLFFGDGADPPEPEDLTGSSFHAQLRVSPEAAFVHLDASTSNGLLIIDLPTAIVSWNVSRSVMRTIPPGVYVYDMLWTRADGTADVEVEGIVTVEQGVTRP
jgi:hypothetical protein